MSVVNRHKSSRIAFTLMGLVLVSFLTSSCAKQENPPASQETVASSELQNKSKMLVNQAEESLKDGDFTGAINTLKAAVKIDPKNADAYFLFARTLMHLENYDQAINYFNAVIQLDPDNGDAHLLLGGCYDMTGNKEKAIQEVEESVNIFREERDGENFKRAMAVLQGLKNTPENQGQSS